MTDFKPAATQENCTGAAPRVLLVEDDPVNMEIAREILGDGGIVVCPAMTGAEAIRLARSETVDLILMDLQLPDIDGYETVRRIIKDTGGKHPPIVALSGSLLGHDLRRCLDVGMVAGEEKPLTLEMMQRLLATHAPRHAARLDETRAGPSPERMAELFRESSARLLGDLDRARAQGDRDGILRAAHTLKSISARMPFGTLTDACASLELLAREPAAALQAAIDAVFAAHRAIQGEAAPSTVSPIQGGASARCDVGPLVLVVDDEENERFLVRRLLEGRGYRVAECEGGASAVEFCRRQPPDAVLLDGLMPGLDGVATCEALRREGTLAKLPVLMYTGLADPAWRARAMAAGANCFVEKAVALEDLQRNLLARLAECGVAAAA